MNTNSIRGLASIIVPCFNLREFTQFCLQSLFRYTRQPWELIVVDNGSTDDTKTYLAGVQDATSVPVTIATNAHNLGFPAGINQGLQLAQGEYLVLLNNDVVVTDGWLDQLVALATAESRPTAENAKQETDEKAGIDRAVETGEAKAETENSNLTIIDFNEVRAETERTSGLEPLPDAPPDDASACDGDAALPVRPSGYPPFPMVLLCAHRLPPRCTVRTHWRVLLRAGHPPWPPLGKGGMGAGIGLVGPMSNYAAPPQLVEGVPYRDLEEMHRFARRWRDEHRGKWFTVPKLSGFCLLMKRAVYEKIGGLDERFGIGFFDDDDLAERARRAGFELAVAHDLFIHHFGSRTFAGNGIDAAALLDENARRFAAKWGLRQTRGHRVALRPFVVARQPSGDAGRNGEKGNRHREDSEPLPVLRVQNDGQRANDNGPRAA